MLAVLFESSLRITLVIAITAIFLRLFAIRSASVRHAMWTAVVSMMLLMPIVVSWAPAFWLRILPEREQPVRAPIVVAMADSSPPIPTQAQLTATPSTKLSSPIPWRMLAFGVYVSGAVFFLLRLAVGTYQVCKMLSSSTLDRVRHVHASCTTPITIGWLRPVMILPASSAEWPAERLLAVITHEEQHILRRDPLIQSLALINRAIFWFHPLAWWLEREIATLAEAACDTAVLAQGIGAEEYSNALVFLARTAHDSGARLQLGTTMPGPALFTRLRAILDGAQPQPLSPWRLTCMAVVISAAMVLSMGNFAQAQPTCGDEPPAPPDSSMPRCRAFISPTEMTMEGATMENIADIISIPITDLGRPVVDRTNIPGDYKVNLEFAFRTMPNGPRTGEEGPSLFTALQEQLGLKLENARASIKVLVIDSAERPTEN
jgi:beta-lactamase regulating signal transducer with metallopeptidase domain